VSLFTSGGLGLVILVMVLRIWSCFCLHQGPGHFDLVVQQDRTRACYLRQCNTELSKNIGTFLVTRAVIHENYIEIMSQHIELSC